MRQYLDLIQHVLATGSWQENRTGIRTISVPGAMMRFDLREGFPAITTKKLAFKSAIAEMVGFLRAKRSAAHFRELGTKVWDQNANENAQWLANPYRLRDNDLGPIYGAQWRQWPAYKLIDEKAPNAGAQINDSLKRGYALIGKVEPLGTEACGEMSTILLAKSIDQVRHCLDTIHTDPGNRRILFHGWNPAQLEEMALPPCHLLYQFLVNQAKREISLCLYIRSNDLGLGAPFNITEGAALLTLFGRLTGYTPATLSYMIGDAHIYENHVDMLTEQLQRAPLPAPRLVLSERIPDLAVTGKYEPQWLDLVEPGDFVLENYHHHAPLTAPMAV